MTWLTWRQHRLQLMATYLVVGVLAAYLVHKSQDIVAYAKTVDPACLGGAPAGCDPEQLDRFTGEPTTIKQLMYLSNLLPAIVGAFWGAPLVAREFERGTYRLAWTQSVSPVRWITGKLTVLTLAAAAGGAATSALFGWAVSGWRITGSVNRFREWWIFDLVGVVPVLLWPLALLLGVAAGLVIRRVSTAMAVSLVLFGTLTIGLAQVRPHYATPGQRPEGSQSTGVAFTDDWPLHTAVLNRSGATVAAGTADRTCPDPHPDPAGGASITGRDPACLRARGWQDVEYYHPASSFWRFQWTQAGVEAVIIAVLAAFILVRVRRRAW